MKFFTAILLGLLSVKVSAQQYRLVYDSSTIPELYYTTTLTLQEQTDNGYRDARERYRLYSKDLSLRGREVFYSQEDLAKTRGRFQVTAEVRGERFPLTVQLPVLTGLRFNFYTDSIKPILNYYVNIEGVFSSGKVYPLTEQQVNITSSIGTMRGMEWIAPPDKSFEKVIFTATTPLLPNVTQSATVYRKKLIDPRDAEGYEERRH